MKNKKAMLAPLVSVLGAAAITSTLLSAQPAQAATTPELGIFLPGSAYNGSILANYESNLGVNFQAAKWYQDWSATLDITPANTYKALGVKPELTWEPTVNGSAVSQSAVLNGQYDTLLNQSAAAAKNFGSPLRINLAPEMNGDWTPWGIYQPGNSAAQFKSFWQYVVNKFNAAGVTNVQWIWTPNIHYYGETASFASFYPGDNYVTYLGLDGYNWGTSQSWSEWTSFAATFQPSYNDLTALSGKNIYIMEVASAEQGGSKAQWITDMFTSLRNNFPRIAGFTWFNQNKEADWRIESSATSKQAFINAAKGIGTTTQPTATPNPTPNPTATPVGGKTKKKAPAVKSTVAPTAIPAPVTAAAEPSTLPQASLQPTATATPALSAKLGGREVSGALTAQTVPNEKTATIISLLILEIMLTWLLFSHSLEKYLNRRSGLTDTDGGEVDAGLPSSPLTKGKAAAH